jgi:hypothetical protein
MKFQKREFEMKKPCLLGSLFLSAIMASSFSYGEWLLSTDDTDGNQWYFDDARIRVVNGDVYWWQMANLLKPLNSSTPAILSFSGYLQTDCKVFRYKKLIIRYYNEPMAQGDIDSEKSEDDEWTYPPPGSSIEKVMEEVCGKAE